MTNFNPNADEYYYHVRTVGCHSTTPNRQAVCNHPDDAGTIVHDLNEVFEWDHALHVILSFAGIASITPDFLMRLRALKPRAHFTVEVDKLNTALYIKRYCPSFTIRCTGTN